MGGRFSRSLDMIKYSASILKQDRELVIFPLLSSIAGILIVLSFVPLFLQTEDDPNAQTVNMILLGLIYLAEYFVVFFFNCALAGAAMIRMDGGNPNVGDGLRIAWSKVGTIFGYTLIAATVGLLLRMIGERMGLVGRIVSGLIGVAWTVASFLVVPVLVSRDIGPVEAVRESATLLKQTWGENLISNAGIGFVFGFAYLVLGGIAALLISASMNNPPVLFTLIGIFAVCLILLTLTQAALQGIFSVVLYRYAADGENPDGFPPGALNEVFAPKLN
ncbi:MAG: DUF6159 family protein [Gammaproteobacteria bacterium]|nr:DUF6159 family protein [Gammaproteobacteria bacterium]